MAGSYRCRIGFHRKYPIGYGIVRCLRCRRVWSIGPDMKHRELDEGHR
jgi:hypothetical protein